MSLQVYKLIPLEEKYFASYVAQFSEVVRRPLHVKSLDAEREYLQGALRRQLSGLTFFYLIIENKSDQVIGAVEIRAPEQFRGQLYTWLNEQYWGSGIFQYALREAASDYFSKTRAHFFDATVDVDNVRSYRALKKASFADLGIQQGAWGKQYVMVLRNSERCG